MIGRVLVAISAVTLLLIGLSSAFVWQGLAAETAIAESWAQRDKAHVLAHELRQSSDDLTRMARTYAATGDERYRRYFQEILDIRNGEAPRPEDYHLVYWDLVTAAAVDDDRPQPVGEPVAFRALMRDAGFTPDELALLAESESESNALTVLEDRAFALVGEGDLAAAQQLLHSDEYHQAKAQIMLPIQRVLQAMERRTAAQIEKLAARQKDLNRYFLAATSVLTALVAVALVLALVAVRHRQRQEAEAAAAAG